MKMLAHMGYLKIKDDLMSPFKLFLFYVPYYIFKRENSKNGVLIFAKCFLLIAANLVIIVIVYCWVTGVSINSPQLTRGGTKLIGLLSMIPFALFYWINKEKYKRSFIEFDQFDSTTKKKWDSYSNLYIYATISLLIASVAFSLWAKFG